MRRGAIVLLAVALAACDDMAEDDAARVPLLDDPPIRAPAAMESGRGTPLDRARFRVVAHDVSWTGDGASASVDRLATTLDAAGPVEMELTGLVAQRTRLGRLEWRVASPSLRVTELRLTGRERAARIQPARLSVELPGRPALIGTLSGRVAAGADGALHGDGLVRVGASNVAIAARRTPSGLWRATLRLQPLVLADAHAIAARIPAHGTARGTIVLRGGDGAFRATTTSLTLATEQSRLTLAGAAARHSGVWSFDSVTLALAPVHPDDWRAWLGSDPLVEAPVRGRLLAHGNGTDGVAVDGSVLADDGAGARLAADVEGTLWLDPRPRLDLRIESRALRLADTGPLDLDLRVSGDADSLAVGGTGRLTPAADSAGIVQRTLDAFPPAIADRLERATVHFDVDVLRADAGRRVRGVVTAVDSTGLVWLSLRGSTPLRGAGALDLSLAADSLPLALLPAPPGVRDVEGFARVRARAGGTTERPLVDADAELVGVRFAVPEYGVEIDSLAAHVRLERERIHIVEARAFRDGGSIALEGGLRLDDPFDLQAPGASLKDAVVDVVALLDTMTLVDMDSARAVVTGRLAVSGELRRPHVAGGLTIVEGHAFEGVLAPRRALDPEDPPYLDLAAAAPWPAGRLSAIAARDTGAGESVPPPLTADLTVGVRPAFRIIDEDSDLGARGGVRVVIDERGARAAGDARIVDGFYAYYGELFQLAGGAFAVEGGSTRLAMLGRLRGADRPLGLGPGGHDGLDRRDPPLGIFGYSTPATVLELLRYRSPLPATQAELASLLLFGVPLQPVDTWDHGLVWRADETDDLIGHRSAIQGSGLLWSYVADELYDYVPLRKGFMRAGTVRIGSRYPGWIMLGTELSGAVHLGARVTARASHVVGGSTWPGIGVRYALRTHALAPAERHIELFNEARFLTGFGTAGERADFDVRRRTGLRARWRWDY